MNVNDSFSIMEGYKINVSIQVAILYTSNGQSENEIKTTLFVITSGKAEHVSTKLTKEA